VLVDGDGPGHEIVARLRGKYWTNWDTSRFQAFSEANFEAYYPSRSSEARIAALAEPNKQTRREKKRRLLEEVRSWIERIRNEPGPSSSCLPPR